MKNSTQEKYRLKEVNRWFSEHKWKPFPFQIQTWNLFLQGKSGLLNAPTGSGKTYALWIPVVMELLELQNFDLNKTPTGLQVIWITPLRALAKDIQKALLNFSGYFKLQWQIEIRTGDTTSSQRARQLQKAPTCLITTPESLHILFSQKKSVQFFKHTKAIIVDEWHELMGTKRGIQTELALSHIKTLSKHQPKIWGISATIGNLEEAAEVLLGPMHSEEPVIIKAEIDKKTKIEHSVSQS